MRFSVNESNEKKPLPKLEMPIEEEVGITEYDVVEGLNGIGITKSECIAKILERCNEIIEQNEGILRGKYQLSREEAFLLASYTHGNGDPEDSPYKNINKKLRDDNYQDQMRDPKSYLCMLLRALRKLSRTEPQTLYRAIRDDTKEYKKGDPILWEGFSSTSPSMKVTKTFIKDKRKNKVSGTLFEIRGIWGYDIAEFSCHPRERGFQNNLQAYLHSLTRFLFQQKYCWSRC